MGTIIENGNRSLQKSKFHPSFKIFSDPLYYQQNFPRLLDNLQLCLILTNYMAFHACPFSQAKVSFSSDKLLATMACSHTVSVGNFLSNQIQYGEELSIHSLVYLGKKYYLTQYLKGFAKKFHKRLENEKNLTFQIFLTKV